MKVESTTRPDGARFGHPEFYRRLHDGHESLVLDFASGALTEVLADADVVVEASWPRALRRLGVHAEEFLAARPGRVWVSITGHGRDDDRVAFGDDAAVAGGLRAMTGTAPRCSSATRSPIPSPVCRPPGPSPVPWTGAAEHCCACPWRPAPRRRTGRRWRHADQGR